ncbi:hypothetical protein [Candidatus Cardinium hertigii]|uniref:hypothetical protein n=1 Tax=Candidatus Cardinium hertigii TaxID=247481 RepID=UPI001FA94DE3|nr:hypothetical protein [Candidatus Cardinium hertigii]
MQSKKVRFLVFVSLFFFQSLPSSSALGVDFIEKAHFNKDGSGEFSIQVDLKKTRNLIAFIKYLHKLRKDYKDITQAIACHAFNKASERLEQLSDISQVCVKHNKKMLKVELSFSFNHIEALNEAMSKIIHKGLDPPKITYFSLDDKLFVREDINGITKKLLYYQDNDNSLIKSLKLLSFFKETSYKTIYTFHKKIKNCSNPLSKFTENTIRITHHVFAPDEIEHSIGNRVFFAKD